MIIQPIVDLAEICAKKGVRHAILSPGSRCAPITLSFVRHPEIHTKTIPDERSAAFIALGMAQQLKQPVVLVCTSGSAAYNYAPAIAEAFFQQIPLLVITADRPPEWIDQWDGQTIRQREIYGKHLKAFFEFPDEFGHQDKVWHANRMANEAINLSRKYPQGPVHLNVPLREPFYPEAGENFSSNAQVRIISALAATHDLSPEAKEELKAEFSRFRKILIVPGQQSPDKEISMLLEELVQSGKCIVVADTISNLQVESSINFHDHFLNQTKDLNPELIISFGKSIISKSLKLFLRKSGAEHWHLSQDSEAPDTYQSLQKIIPMELNLFLGLIEEKTGKNDKDWAQSWKSKEEKVKEILPEIIGQQPFNEFQAIAFCLKGIPQHSKVHLANSMAVRYVNFLGARTQEIFCNRGTSGIDGSNSTAVGCAMVSEEMVTLITGDMAFFYDRNAFWHNYPLPNLRIIILNNHAGGIFRMIDGPAKLPELEEYFETKQKLTAASLSRELDFGYHLATDQKSLEAGMKDFYEPSGLPKILEIQTKSEKNASLWKKLKTEVSRHLEFEN